MRLLALIFTLIIPFTFAMPAQVAEHCECMPSEEMGQGHCCQVPMDCCLDTSIPSYSFDWLWERSNLDATPQLVLLAILEVIDTPDLHLGSAAFSLEPPPPRGARTLRSFQQIWLI